MRACQCANDLQHVRLAGINRDTMASRRVTRSNRGNLRERSFKTDGTMDATRGGALALAAVLVSVDAGAQFVDNRFETVDTVRASDVLTATLYQSAHHQVLDEVGVRQNSYVFRVDTGAQRFTVASKVLLEERVHENAVLAQAVAQFEARNKNLRQSFAACSPSEHMMLHKYWLHPLARPLT